MTNMDAEASSPGLLEPVSAPVLDKALLEDEWEREDCESEPPEPADSEPVADSEPAADSEPVADSEPPAELAPLSETSPAATLEAEPPTAVDDSSWLEAVKEIEAARKRAMFAATLTAFGLWAAAAAGTWAYTAMFVLERKDKLPTLLFGVFLSFLAAALAGRLVYGLVVARSWHDPGMRTLATVAIGGSFSCGTLVFGLVWSLFAISGDTVQASDNLGLLLGAAAGISVFLAMTRVHCPTTPKLEDPTLTAEQIRGKQRAVWLTLPYLIAGYAVSLASSMLLSLGAPASLAIGAGSALVAWILARAVLSAGKDAEGWAMIEQANRMHKAISVVVALATGALAYFVQSLSYRLANSADERMVDEPTTVQALVALVMLIAVGTVLTTSLQIPTVAGDEPPANAADLVSATRRRMWRALACIGALLISATLVGVLAEWGGLVAMASGCVVAGVMHVLLRPSQQDDSAPDSQVDSELRQMSAAGRRQRLMKLAPVGASAFAAGVTLGVLVALLHAEEASALWDSSRTRLADWMLLVISPVWVPLLTTVVAVVTGLVVSNLLQAGHGIDKSDIQDELREIARARRKRTVALAGAIGAWLGVAALGVVVTEAIGVPSSELLRLFGSVAAATMVALTVHRALVPSFTDDADSLGSLATAASEICLLDDGLAQASSVTVKQPIDFMTKLLRSIGCSPRARYEISDQAGGWIGSAQEPASGWLWRLLLGPRRNLELVVDEGDQKVFTLRRPKTWWLSRAQIFDRQRAAGTVRRRFSLLRRCYSVLDAAGNSRFELRSGIFWRSRFDILRGDERVGALRGLAWYQRYFAKLFGEEDSFRLDLSELDAVPTSPSDDSSALDDRRCLLGAVLLIDQTHFSNEAAPRTGLALLLVAVLALKVVAAIYSSADEGTDSSWSTGDRTEQLADSDTDRADDPYDDSDDLDSDDLDSDDYDDSEDDYR